VTLQGCSNDAEPPTLTLRGEQNVTAAQKTSAAGTTTGITASQKKTTASTEDVPNEETKTSYSNARALAENNCLDNSDATSDQCRTKCLRTKCLRKVRDKCLSGGCDAKCLRKCTRKDWKCLVDDVVRKHGCASVAEDTKRGKCRTRAATVFETCTVSKSVDHCEPPYKAARQRCSSNTRCLKDEDIKRKECVASCAEPNKNKASCKKECRVAQLVAYATCPNTLFVRSCRLEALTNFDRCVDRIEKFDLDNDEERFDAAGQACEEAWVQESLICDKTGGDKYKP